MTLGDFIDQFEKDDAYIRIGSASGWLFVGTKTEWEKYHEAIEQAAKAQAEFCFTQAKRALNFALTNKKKFDAEKFENAHEAAENYVKMLEANIKRIHSLEKTLNRAEERLSAYTPLLTREIEETYTGLSVTDGGAFVIIKGYEQGRYWDREEFEKYFIKGEKRPEYEKEEDL